MYSAFKYIVYTSYSDNGEDQFTVTLPSVVGTSVGAGVESGVIALTGGGIGVLLSVGGCGGMAMLILVTGVTGGNGPGPTAVTTGGW